MKLLSLTLRNFKGIRQFELDTQGGDIAIYGDNAVGKTTLFDAFTWLLFDKDSANKKDFAIKTLDTDGQPLHGLEHEVEGVFDIDGREVGLRKVYTEKWTKKRGSATAEFTGHETNHFVDGVPVTKGEYSARVAEIADESVFRLLTDPAYFNEQLHWQERRRILLEVCGDVSDSDVIASDAALARLPGILNGRKLDDHRKVIAARRAEINRELERIPVRIDEVTQGLPDISGQDRGALETQVADLRARKQAKEEERVRIQAGGEVAEKTRRINEIRSEVMGIERQAEAAAEEQNRQARLKLNQITDQISAVELQVKSKCREIESNNASIGRAERRMADLRAEWARVDGPQFAFQQNENCPACGQTLPAERLEEAREKALGAFNQEKARQLTDVTARGKQAKAEADGLRQQNARLEQEIAALEARRAGLEGEKGKYQDVPTIQPDYSGYPDFAAKSQEINTLEDEIAQLRAGNTDALATVDREIAGIDDAIRALEQAAARVEARRQGLARIEELKAQERTLAGEYERLEEELYLAEQFIRSKVRILEDRINSRFAHARFRLFDVQVNGGVSECCETTYQGVPYGSGLNNGARINIGLDISNSLSEHYGFAAPIWCDNAEAVTRLIPTRGQLIKLVVSEPDKVLRVEREEALVNA